MGRTYRWLGGIGYILALIPLINFVGLILIAIAWIMMGGETRQGVFKAAGILMIIMMVASAAGYVALLPMFGMLGFGGFGGTFPSAPSVFGAFTGLLILLIVVAVLGLITFILELISHFRAANIYGVAWFRRAAWMRIIAIILMIIIIPILFFIAGSIGMTPRPGALLGLGWMFGLMILPGIVALLAAIFSAIAFFTVPEAPPAYQYQPPPPPPPPYYGPQAYPVER